LKHKGSEVFGNLHLHKDESKELQATNQFNREAQNIDRNTYLECSRGGNLLKGFPSSKK